MASGQAFAVEPAHDVLAVDCDRVDQTAKVIELFESLESDGLEPVVVPSGQPGRLHLWCKIPNPEALKASQAQALHLGLDVRGQRGPLRPPLSRHRLPLHMLTRLPSMADPRVLEEQPWLGGLAFGAYRFRDLGIRRRALARLEKVARQRPQPTLEETYSRITRERPLTWPEIELRYLAIFGEAPPPSLKATYEQLNTLSRSHRPRAPRPQMAAPLRSPLGNAASAPKLPAAGARTPPSNRQAAVLARRPLRAETETLLREGLPRGQRSEGIWKFLVAAVNAGWSFELETLAVLMEPTNALGEKLREQNHPRRWLEAQWNKAERFVANNPPVADRVQAMAEVASLREAVEQSVWSGVAGTTDRLVVLAHLAIAERSGKLYHSASVREVAETLGIKAETVARSHRRLRDKGWLQLVTPYRRGTTEATIWKVQEPRNSSNAARKIGTVITSGGGVRRTVPMVRVVQPHDVWRRGGLGLGAGLVWSQTDAHYPVQAKAVAGDIGKHPSVVRRHFTKLEKHGLVVKSASGWLRGLADLDEVSQVLGVTGKGAKQRAQYIRDREAFRELRDARAVGQLRRSSSGSGCHAPLDTTIGQRGRA
jgi:Mn-dependent DtxR family transcriptional regulator